jgi:hypothetical protein
MDMLNISAAATADEKDYAGTTKNISPQACWARLPDFSNQLTGVIKNIFDISLSSSPQP